MFFGAHVKCDILQFVNLTAIITRETLSDDSPIFVSQCPELDIVSQGETKTEALANLREAIELFFEVADDAEIGARLRNGATVSALEVVA